MPYVQEENGKLNNFPIEVKPELAEPPTTEQKKMYIIMGICGAALVLGAIWVASLVS